MAEGKKLDVLSGSSEPSAPPLPTPIADTMDHPLTESRPKRNYLSKDEQLVRDLFRKAEGDPYKVASWLEVMGETVAAEELRNEVSQIPSSDHHEKQGDDMDAAAAQLGAPETYFCPISFHLFRDPVCLQTGQTYERSAIQRWLAEGGSICPATGLELPQPVILSPNVTLRQAIEDWASKNAIWMLDKNGKLIPLPENERRHFAVHTHSTSTDADTALAIHLQEAELAQQASAATRNGISSHARRQGDGGTSLIARNLMIAQNDAKRIQRCVHLLFFITVLLFGMFLVTLSKGDWEFEKIDANPLIGFRAQIIDRVGGTDTSLIADENEWWRVITSSLMTAGIIHFQWVISCLWTFGRFLSARMSFVSLGLLYIVSCISGVLLSANFSTVYVTAGASAGAFGLIGAVFIEITINHKDYKSFPASLLFLALMSSVGVFMGLTPMVDNWTNLGGFLSGIITAAALRLTYQGHEAETLSYFKELGMIILQVSLFLIMALLITGGCIGLFIKIDQREDCQWCRKLACVSTTWWSCDVARILPKDCAFDFKGNLTTHITCPGGKSQVAQLTDISNEALDDICEELCDLRKDDDDNDEKTYIDDRGRSVVLIPNPSTPPSTPGGYDGSPISSGNSRTEANVINALESGNMITNKRE